MPEVATPNQAEREFETGSDEFFKNKSQTNSLAFDAWFANIKRTYDEFQQESLETIRLQRSYAAKILSDANQHDNARQTIATQALQNAVETANMVSKQAVRHSDIAIDGQWNPVQQGTGDNITGRTVMDTAVAAKAVDAAIAKSVDASIAPVVGLLADLVKSVSAMTAQLASANAAAVKP